jgi:DNA-binding response OmpR family regulator
MTTSALPKTTLEKSHRLTQTFARPPWSLPGFQRRLAREGPVQAGTVLVIEDDPHLSSAMRLRLERAGLVVHSALDGPSGLMSYHSISPDLVVLDLNLPGMNGERVLKFVRTSANFKQAPVIAITGITDPGLHARIREWGVAELMVKPIPLRGLVQSVLRTLRNE